MSADTVKIDKLREGLKGRWPATRQERFPAQDAKLFAAVRSMAWAVAAGFVERETVEGTIIANQRVRTAEPVAGGSLKHALISELQEAITAAEIDRDKAQRAISKEIGHLIDAGRPSSEILAAAKAANGQALLTPREIDSIVAREQAWWVRLHAQLDHAQLNHAQLNHSQAGRAHAA